MVDAGGSDAFWQGGYKWALRAAEMLANYGVAWFEEPLDPDALEDYVALRNASPVPIAGGEVLTRRQSFRPWLQAGAFDVVQPDVTKVGGISEERRIGWMAEENGVRFIPHGWNTAVGLAADLQLASAFPATDLVEYKTGSPYIDEISAEPWGWTRTGCCRYRTRRAWGCGWTRTPWQSTPTARLENSARGAFVSIFRTKPIEQSIREAEEPDVKLRRALGPLQLALLGIGVTIGAGIFVLTGVAAATRAGPAITISFVIAGVATALAALCYAEFASTVPVAGSSYTFSYASLGEFVAWMVGWDLILELTVGPAAVSVGWSQYAVSFLGSLGITFPQAISGEEGSVINLPAALIPLVVTAILVVGIRTTSRVNVFVTLLKLAIIVFFLVVGVWFVDAANLSPFVPPRASSGVEAVGFSLDTPLLDAITGRGLQNYAFGFAGIGTGAAIVFGAYVGFDIMANGAEEARDPQRSLPIGILAAIAVCTVLYVAVALVLTGVVPYEQLNTAAPMAEAFEVMGLGWGALLVSAGAIAGLTTVVMIQILGQSRVFFAMSRDGLLPAWFSNIHPRFRTPHRITIVTGVAVAVIASSVPIVELAELGNIGTLAAFVVVSIGVVYLRRARPDLRRGFRVPLVPLVPILAVAVCLYLRRACRSSPGSAFSGGWRLEP